MVYNQAITKLRPLLPIPPCDAHKAARTFGTIGNFLKVVVQIHPVCYKKEIGHSRKVFFQKRVWVLPMLTIAAGTLMNSK